MSKRSNYLIAELTLIFFLLPLLLSILGSGKVLIVILWGCATAAVLAIRSDPAYKFKSDWNWAAVKWPALKVIFARFVFCAFLLTAFTLLHDREKFLSLPSERPKVWAFVMVAYPVLSVIPQEFIYRTFIKWRYASLFSSPSLGIALSAIAFGWVHILLYNWIAITFSLLGGIFFAHTYFKHRSLALAAIEHALYGCFIFTIGLGWYFYHARFQ